MSKKKRPLTAEEKRRKKRSALGTWILVLIMLIGLGIMAYPTVSDWWNSFHASRAIASYSNAVEKKKKKKLDEMIQAAHEYNEKLLKKPNPYTMTDEDMAEYNSLLDLSGTGIIGYITIKSIGVYIPIYHGVEESVLQIAIGHIEWTSLPVGGESTHAVVSGHRGLPSAKLFTDLDQLREGDTFSITVLNQMITYEVDQIRIVEPGDISELAIAPGKDYCTLVTCTPYGINTHRLLIRGTRVANEAGELVVPAEAFRIPNYITIPAIGVPLLFLTLIILLKLVASVLTVDSGGDGGIFAPSMFIGAVPGFVLADLVVLLDALGDLEADGFDRVQRRHRILEDHGDLVAADLLHLLFLQRQQVLSLIDDLAGGDVRLGGRQDAHDALGDGGLARPGLAHQSQRFPLLQGEVHAVDGVDRGLVGTVFHRKVFDFQKLFSHGRHLSSSGADPARRAGRRPEGCTPARRS